MKTAKQRYERRKERYIKLRQKQETVESMISNLRLAVFIAGVGAILFMAITHKYMLFAAVLTLCIALFIYLIINHEKLITRMKYTRLLGDINNQSLKRLQGEWGTFTDDGEDFVNDNHDYTGDLDIFGKNSLFQWINSANTYLGRQMLNKLLSGISGNSHELHERQEAVNELAAMLNWRQRFEAEGKIVTEKLKNPEALITWGREGDVIYRRPWIIAILRICPVITVILVLLGFVMDIIPRYLPAAALLIQYALLSYKGRERHRSFGVLEKYNDDLRAYYKMLKLLEKRHFESAHIKRIKDGIRNIEGYEAFRQVDRLASIVDSIANRRNIFYFAFNILTLWDLQSVIALERWKEKSGHLLQDWFEALAKMEALVSLAIIGFDNPDWVIPTVTDGTEAMLQAKGLGHPLLGVNRVYNDLTADENTKILLITGSNMSGKSTLLRTAGINLVLAYAGAPVCANSFQTSIMEMYSCMRVKDNLEESISSFYAELLRIKRIVGEVELGKKVFFLLDEIFKGTNSEDRHTGARVLINKLSTTNSVGLVSTHDIELCDLEQKNDKIANYHFQEYYEAGKIHFDYKLRLGPSTTRNALHLMRLAGLEVDENSDLKKC